VIDRWEHARWFNDTTEFLEDLFAYRSFTKASDDIGSTGDEDGTADLV
jgi:hypothetical protein